MDIILYIILLALSGLIVGALGRLLLPGRDPMSIVQTIALGIAASLISGLLLYYVFDSDDGGNIFFSILCAIALVYVVRKVRERNSPRRL